MASPLGAQPVVTPSLLASAAPYPGTRRAAEIARGREFSADVVGWLGLGRVLWSSGYDQLAGSPNTWPQDAESYGRRVLTRSAQLVTIETVRHTAAAVLGRDPSYVACACDGLWRRLGHATAGVFTDFDVAGRRRAAWPRFLGATAGSVMLGQLQPGQGTAETVAVRAVTTVSASWLGNVAKEFHLVPRRGDTPDATRGAPAHPAPVPTAPLDTAAFTRSFPP
jgi:hypothetical protein